MFGRRVTPFGSKSPSPPAPPSPPPGDTWHPQEKMDAALVAAIRLFTRTLDQAGQDCGGLALRGALPPSVSALLADCVVYPGEEQAEYLSLGITKDFEAFSYQPHCQLFMILNAAMIIEDLPDTPERERIGGAQIPRALIDAHMMWVWIKYIRPVGAAMARQDMDALGAIPQVHVAETAAVEALAPKWIADLVDLNACRREWCSGFPGTIGRKLTDNVKRINDLPMSDFVAQQITDFLVRTQMEGNAEQMRRAMASDATISAGRESRP